MKRARVCAALSGLLLTTSCALGPMTRGGVTPATRMGSAVAALEDGDVPAARRTLQELVAACARGELGSATGRRAALLLTTVELDPRNLDGSPEEAARLAAALAELSPEGSEDGALALVLYGLAVDRGAPIHAHTDDVPAPISGDPGGCIRTETARGRALPVPSEPTLARRMAELQDSARHLEALRDSLESRTQALTRVRGQLQAATTRIWELEAEIARVRQLLRGGMPGETPSERRPPGGAETSEQPAPPEAPARPDTLGAWSPPRVAPPGSRQDHAHLTPG